LIDTPKERQVLKKARIRREEDEEEEEEDAY